MKRISVRLKAGVIIAVVGFIFLFISGDCYAQCDKNITTNTDKFTGVTKRSTLGIIDNPSKQETGTNILSIKKKIIVPVTITHSISQDSGSSYTILVSVVGKESQFSGPSGIYLILEDGSKIIYESVPVVNTTIGDQEFYIGSTTISKEEFQRLKTLKITDVRADLYDCSLSNWLSSQILTAANCID